MTKPGKTPKKKTKEKSPQRTEESEYPAMDEETYNRLLRNAIEHSKAELEAKTAHLFTDTQRIFFSKYKSPIACNEMVMPTPRNCHNHAGVIKDFEDNGYVTWATHADGCNYGDLTSHRRWLLLCLLQDEGKKVNIDDWDLGTMGCPPMAPY